MRKISLTILIAISPLLFIPPHLKAEFVTQSQDKLRGAADSGMAVVIENLGAKERARSTG